MNIEDKQRNNFKYRKTLMSNPTREELIVKKWLDDVGIYYKFQKGFLKPFHRIVDFYIPKKKIIIEIDGGYHNDIYFKDRRKDLTWKSLGFKTIRILNNEVVNGEYKEKLSFLCF